MLSLGISGLNKRLGFGIAIPRVDAIPVTK